MSEQKTYWRWLPDWGSGMSETISYLTDRQATDTGNEYRSRLREHPRRSIGFASLVDRHHFRDLDAALHGAEAGEWVVPVWWLRDTSLGFDEVGGVYEYEVDDPDDWVGVDYVLVWSRDAWHGSTLTTPGLDGIRLEEEPPEHLQRAGVRLYPAHPAAIESDLTREAITAAVATCQAEASFLGHRVHSSYEPELEYGDLPVFDIRPNRVSPLEAQYVRLTETIDFELGVRAFYDDADFPHTAHQREYLLDEDQTEELVELFHHVGGSAGRFWTPTANADLEVVGVDVDEVTIRTLGWEQHYDGAPTRQHLYFRLRDGGPVLREIDSASVDGDEETLTLADPVDFDAGDIRQVCWLELSRFGSDTLTIDRITPALSEVTLTLVTLRDDDIDPDPVPSPE